MSEINVRRDPAAPNYVIAERDGKRLGHILYGTDDDEKHVYIHDVWTEPEERGKGVAHKILDKMSETLKPGWKFVHRNFRSPEGERFAWSYAHDPKHLIEDNHGNIRPFLPEGYKTATSQWPLAQAARLRP